MVISFAVRRMSWRPSARPTETSSNLFSPVIEIEMIDDHNSPHGHAPVSEGGVCMTSR